MGEVGRLGGGHGRDKQAGRWAWKVSRLGG